MGARYFGAEVNRLEDPALLAGNGRYVDDFDVPGLAHAAFVRSPHPHARIKAISADAARSMPGVIAVLTLADLDPEQRVMPPVGPAGNLQPFKTPYPLARDAVHHVGETVAMVVAANRHQAEDAAYLVDVDYEPLGAVADWRQALEPGAPTAHEGLASNLVAPMKVGFGDVAAVFAKAAHVFEETIRTHRGGCHSMECRGVVARSTSFGPRRLWEAARGIGRRSRPGGPIRCCGGAGCLPRRR